MIDELFEEAKIKDDGANITFELYGFKFRFQKLGKGLMRKRRRATSILAIQSPSDADLDAIDSFMHGFSVSKGDDKYVISDQFTVDDFLAKTPETEDGNPVQFEISEQMHKVAAVAILGNEQAAAILKRSGVSD